ncbi:MAG: hypothetical protein LUG24_03875 [Clostridiales bacterium]|nr:hypothetical protein [Clostridiales bacterium]
MVINPLNGLYNMDFEGAYFIGCTHVRKFLTKLNGIRPGKENTAVIHYFGKQKPWNEKYRGVLDIFYKELKAEMKDN